MKFVITVDVDPSDVDDEDLNSFANEFKEHVKDEVFNTDPGLIFETANGIEFTITSVSIGALDDE